MAGFFTSNEVESKTRPDGKTYSCISCGLFNYCKSPKMKTTGNFRKKILIISDFVSKTDDRIGKYWQDKPGQLLQQTLKDFGIDLFEDCITTSAVLCHNENPTKDHVLHCRGRLLQVVDKLKPSMIICLGFTSFTSLISHRWKKDLGTYNKWHGWMIPDQDIGCWLTLTDHPRSIIDQDDEFLTIWRKEIKQAIDYITVDFKRVKAPKIEFCDNLDRLNDIKAGMIAFDYETTGIKPHAPGHRIICCSIALHEDHAIVFMMPNKQSERMPFINILKNPNIDKIAQNLKFEHTWSIVRLRTEPVGWIWDTMLATHIIDNRPDITGLKFQTYVQFGVIDYDSEIHPYLESGSKDGNAINRIDQLIKHPGGQRKLMEYCAMDSIFEYRLAILQQEIIGITFLPF